jgi:inhibitor of cysteine peptidase
MKTLSAPLAALALAAALPLVMSLGACATVPAPPTLTVSQPGPVALARGQGLDIVLPMNAGTGYGWRLDQEASPILGGGSSRVTDTDRPGGPVTTIYSYQALARGKTTLAFTLKRPWMPDAPDDQKAVFQVKVR